MKPKRVLITAGYSRAPHVHLLLDLLMEKDIEIAEEALQKCIQIFK